MEIIETKLEEENQTHAQVSITQMENVKLRKRKLQLENKVRKLEDTIENIKKSLNDSAFETVMSKALSLPASLVERYSRKVQVALNYIKFPKITRFC